MDAWLSLLLVMDGVCEQTAESGRRSCWRAGRGVRPRRSRPLVVGSNGDGSEVANKPREVEEEVAVVREVMLGLEQNPESGRRSRLRWGRGVRTRKRGPLVDSDGVSFRTKPGKSKRSPCGGEEVFDPE